MVTSTNPAPRARPRASAASSCASAAEPTAAHGVRLRQRAATLFGLAVALAAVASPSGAHEFAITDALVVLRADSTYQVDVRVDVDALALGVSPATDNALLVAELAAMDAAEVELALANARDTVARRVRVRFDGDPVRPAVSFPRAEIEAAEDGSPPSRFGTVARLAGRCPPGATTFSMSASRAFGPVQLTLLDERHLTGTRVLLAPGERSPPWRLDGPPPGGEAGGAQPGTIARYLALGFEHILPLGVDHILFVIGLFLLAARWRPLLWQVSAFTLAHTLSLALSMAGVVSLPSRLVETLIAASIAYVAIENIFTERMHAWRPLLVFGFGLLHGLGFAGVLRELGLPEGEWITSLVSFNVGVELGQLTVIGLAFLAVGWFRDRALVSPLDRPPGLGGDRARRSLLGRAARVGALRPPCPQPRIRPCASSPTATTASSAASATTPA